MGVTGPNHQPRLDELILGFPVPDDMEVGAGAPAPGSPYTPRSPELSDPKLLEIGHGHGSLSVGARGSAVKGLQQALMALGALPRGNADGIFGRGTSGAVAPFQRAHGLTPDGKVGRKTLEALDMALRVKAEAARREAGSTGTTGTGTGTGTEGTRTGTATPAPTHYTAPAGLDAAEKRAFDRVAEDLFLGARPGRFDLAVTTAETDDALGALDALPAASYRKVMGALLATPARAGEGSLVDTLVIRGTSDTLNFEQSARFYRQMKSKLGSADEVVSRLTPLARQKLMGLVRTAGIG